MIIGVEGVDGSGKSTLARGLGERFSCEVVGFPRPGSQARIEIDDSGVFFQRPWKEQMMLCALDRLEWERAWRLEGMPRVVCDRTMLSTLVYQGALAHIADQEVVFREVFLSVASLLAPVDLLFVLNAPVSVCVDRVRRRRGKLSNVFDQAAAIARHAGLYDAFEHEEEIARFECRLYSGEGRGMEAVLNEASTIISNLIA